MNLLGKVKSIGALALGLLFLNSCEESGGFGFGTDDLAPVEFSVETLPITSSVVLLDSIRSSNLGVGLIGNVDDPDFGRLKATSYAKLNLKRSSLRGISEEAILDSAKLNIKFSYLYNENSNMVGLEVKRLSEELNDASKITANSTAISNDVIAMGEIFIDSDNLDSVYVIDVDSGFAIEIFEKLIANDEDVANQEDFELYFPGVAFQALGAQNSAFGIGLNQQTNITLYYREPSVINNSLDDAKTHVMTFGELSHYFGVEGDRSLSTLSEILNTRVEYTLSSGKNYVQSGGGVVTKIDLSALEHFAENNSRIIVNTAQVSLGPIEDLPEGLSPPSSLLLLLTDSRNIIIRDGNALRAIQQDGANPIDSNNPLRLVYNKETRTYTSPITSFIINYISGVFRRDEFFIYPESMNTTLDQFVFAPEDFKLKIFYSELK